jgi:hypothetical protein
LLIEISRLKLAIDDLQPQTDIASDLVLLCAPTILTLVKPRVLIQKG